MLDDLLQSSGYTSTSTSEREKERSGGGRERGGGGSDRGREGGGGGGGGISILTSAAGMSGRSRRSSLEPLYESTLSTEVSPAIDYNRLDQKKKLKKRRSISTETQ